ncbi:MAG: glycosyltransferase [Chloroflexi bacterium]|nr:glycosyltransferase [Chloroflexota bacterium]
MHVLLIARCPPYPLHLGDRLIVYHLGRELARLGHVIDLLAFSDDPAADWAARDHYADFFDHIELIAEPPRSVASYLRRLIVPGSRWPRAESAAWSPEMWRAIRARLESGGYDVAHLFGGVQVYEYRYALGDLPTIITPYESYSLYLRRALAAERRPADALRWLMAQAYERWMFTPYRRVIVVSDRDRAALHGLNLALPLTVIPNGVDLERFQPPDPAAQARESAVLLFTGNYSYAPNRDAALYLAESILPRVRAQIPAARLWLVGSDPPPELLALHGDHIAVTGYVPDVRPYVQRATVFVSALRFGAGIKNKVLEALALGCPVAATPLSVDGIAVTDGHDALIADGDALVGAVLRLLSDADLRARLAVNGRRLIAARYSWGQVAAQYTQIYAEISG